MPSVDSPRIGSATGIGNQVYSLFFFTGCSEYGFYNPNYCFFALQDLRKQVAPLLKSFQAEVRTLLITMAARSKCFFLLQIHCLNVHSIIIRFGWILVGCNISWLVMYPAVPFTNTNHGAPLLQEEP